MFVNQLILYIIPLILTKTSRTRAVPAAVVPISHAPALVPVSSAAAQPSVRMCEKKDGAKHLYIHFAVKMTPLSTVHSWDSTE